MTIVGLVAQSFDLYELAMLLRVLLSWLRAFGAVNPYSSFVRAVYQLTDPVFLPARAFYERILSMFRVDARDLRLDFSPIFAFGFVKLAREISIRLLMLIFG
ncbi:MAG: YggT family protein [Deltaproteobacteria bacterium]|nr:YggT family protein [Deltaproteobacteria bacterium]